MASVKRLGGEGSEIAENFANKRQIGSGNKFAKTPDTSFKGQIREVKDAFDRALLIKSQKTGRSVKAQIMTEQETKGRKLYSKAYNSQDSFDISQTLNETLAEADIFAGKINRSLKKAINLFKRGKKNNKRPVTTIRMFDAGKKELDDMIMKARGNQKRLLVKFKNNLLKSVHGSDDINSPRINKTYKEARETWGSAAENREAIELGEKVFQTDAEDVIEAFKELSPGQKKLFRLGLRDSLRKALARKRPGDDVTRIFQEDRVINTLEEVLPASKSSKADFNNRPERFGDFIGRQGRKIRTRNQVVGGSPTAERTLDDAQLLAETSKNSFQRFASSPISAAIEFIGDKAVKIFGIRQEVARDLAKILTNTNPQQQRQILERLQLQFGDEALEKFVRAMDQSALGTSIGANTSIQGQLVE